MGFAFIAMGILEILFGITGVFLVFVFGFGMLSVILGIRSAEDL